MGNQRIRLLTPVLMSMNSAGYAGVVAPDMIAFWESAALTSALTVAPAALWPLSLGGEA